MLAHKGTITIETEDLILRKFTSNDADAMFNNWARDEEVAKYMRWNAHKSINETGEVLANWIKKIMIKAHIIGQLF